MALLNFVSSYDDLSTDRGYQFRFKCDKCGNGHTSEYKTSTLGAAQSLISAASGFFSGLYSANNAAYELQRAVGGKNLDSALNEAADAARPQFRHCPGCAKWVCLQACWNDRASQCEDCSPAAGQVAQAESSVANTCAGCGAETGNAKFCPECGQPVKAGPRPCSQCGTVSAAKFCPDCGNKL